MSGMVERDGRFYRWRRGRLVEIPPGWLGKVTTDKTKRERRMEARGKRRRWGRTRARSKDRARLRHELDGEGAR